MSYEYRDLHGDFVQVQEHEDGAWVIINQGRGGAAVTLDMAEAQRFTDAVMDAAIAYEDRKRAKREAEDAKVREFIRTVQHSPALDDYPVSQADRGQYHRAREFFTRDEGISVEALAEALGHELPEQDAPRVLHHGDPEPGTNTRWRDADGIRWVRPFDGWITSPADEEGVEWSSIHPDHFPMTEVLS